MTLHLRVTTPAASHIHIGTSTDSVQVCLMATWLRFLRYIILVISRRLSLGADSLVFWLLWSFCTLFGSIACLRCKAYVAMYQLRLSTTRSVVLCIVTSCGFLTWPWRLGKGASLMASKWESHIPAGSKISTEKQLGIIWVLFWDLWPH